MAVSEGAITYCVVNTVIFSIYLSSDFFPSLYFLRNSGKAHSLCESNCLCVTAAPDLARKGLR